MRIEDIKKAFKYANNLSKQGFVLWLEIEAQWRERNTYRGEIIYEYSKEKGKIIQADLTKLNVRKYESLIFSMMIPLQISGTKHLLIFRVGKTAPLDFIVRAIHFTHTPNPEWCVNAVYTGKEPGYISLDTMVKKNIPQVLLGLVKIIVDKGKDEKLKPWKKHVIQGNNVRLEIEVYKTMYLARVCWEIMNSVDEYYDKIKQV